MVAPALFANLEDRVQAGSLAGVMFDLIAYIGLLCGAVLLLFNQLRSVGRRLNWRALVLAAMLLLVAIGEFYLAPQIAELRAQGLSDSPAFGRWHAVASVAYLATSLLGLLLVAAGTDTD
jgi:hypothetical protein